MNRTYEDDRVQVIGKVPRWKKEKLQRVCTFYGKKINEVINDFIDCLPAPSGYEPFQDLLERATRKLLYHYNGATIQPEAQEKIIREIASKVLEKLRNYKEYEPWGNMYYRQKKFWQE